MKPTMQRRLIKQALSNNDGNFKNLERERKFGMFDSVESTKMAIKDTNKLIKILKRETNS